MSRAAAIYARISKDPTGHALGVERQEALCRELASEQGWEVVETFVDNDLSAYSGAPRPAYDAMLEAMEAGVIEAVVVVDQDRLTRHTRELEEFIELAEDLGVALANVSGDVDLSSSDGRFKARIMGAVARQESERKSERIKRQRDQAAAKGLPASGRRAFGYEPGGMQIREDEAKLIRDAAARVLEGESISQIAREWNNKGYRTVQAGSRWTTPRVSELLRSPRPAGLRQHRGEIVGEAAWPAIIDRDTHERLNAMSKARGGGRPPVTLLSGVLVCGLCKEPMNATTTTMKQGRRSIYRCHATAGTDRCGRISIDAEGADGWISDAVLHRIENGGLAKALEAASGYDAKVSQASDQLAAAEKRLSEVAEMFGAGDISRAEWLAFREAAEGKADEARRIIERATDSPALASVPVDRLREWWEDEDTEVDDRRTVVEAVLRSVEVGPMPETGPRRFRPERFGEPEWRA